MEIEVALGIPVGQREAVAMILYDALENEFRPIFGPRARAAEIIRVPK